MTKAVEFELGTVRLSLRWSKRAEYRLSEAGFSSYDPRRVTAYLFAMLAACNEHPATKHLTGEDLYAEQPECETPEEAEELVKAIGETLEEVVRLASAKPRGKQNGSRKKNGPSRGGGSG